MARTATPNTRPPQAKEQRRFIRHPAAVPIRVDADGPGGGPSPRTQDVSAGGLSFVSPTPVPTGRSIRLCIPSVSPVFEASARVCWCHRRDDGRYLVGVQFADREELFRLRMVEQVCHIEAYRKAVRRREGRVLDGETAAREWIERYAADFPDPGL